MKKWQCGVCGYIHEGDEPPERCPKCGAPKEQFVALAAEAANLLDRARFSNNLHTELHALMEKVIALAGQGIEDNLDPGCITVFRYALAQAKVVQAMVKAEIASHQAKGKWG